MKTLLTVIAVFLCLVAWSADSGAAGVPEEPNDRAYAPTAACSMDGTAAQVGDSVRIAQELCVGTQVINGNVCTCGNGKTVAQPCDQPVTGTGKPCGPVRCVPCNALCINQGQ